MIEGALANACRTGTRRDLDQAVCRHEPGLAGAARRVETVSADVVTAHAFLRRLDLPVRPPDTINIATGQRTGATLAPFDDKMRAAATALGVAAADLLERITVRHTHGAA